MAARDAVKTRMFGLIRKVRGNRLRGLKKVPAVEEAKEPEVPEDELSALEALLGEEPQEANEGG